MGRSNAVVIEDFDETVDRLIRPNGLPRPLVALALLGVPIPPLKEWNKQDPVARQWKLKCAGLDPDGYWIGLPR